MANKKKYNWDEDYNYMQGKQDAEANNDLFTAAQMEADRNRKIDAGYGGGYEKTNDYNFGSKYDNKLDDLRRQRENYEDFSYDPYSDDAYKSLAKVYSRNAERATANALAQAAAANGGRVSAGVGTAAALAYQDKMAQLEAEIPALRNAAYQMYMDKYNRMGESLNDYMNADATDYSRWSDRYNRLYQGMRDRVEDARMNSYYDTINQSTRFNDQLNAAKWLGQATEQSAPLLGVAPGTYGFDAQDAFANRQLQYGMQIGRIPASVLSAYGFDTKGIADANGFVNTADLSNAQLSALVSLAVNKNAGGSARDVLNYMYGTGLNPSGSSAVTGTKASGTVPKASGTGGSGGSGGGASYTGGSAENQTATTPAPSSYEKQIMNERTDQDKAMKAEALLSNGNITEEEFIRILKKIS
jgi:hypothetical protein